MHSVITDNQLCRQAEYANEFTSIGGGSFQFTKKIGMVSVHSLSHFTSHRSHGQVLYLAFTLVNCSAKFTVLAKYLSSVN